MPYGCWRAGATALSPPPRSPPRLPRPPRHHSPRLLHATSPGKAVPAQRARGRRTALFDRPSSSQGILHLSPASLSHPSATPVECIQAASGGGIHAALQPGAAGIAGRSAGNMQAALPRGGCQQGMRCSCQGLLPATAQGPGGPPVPGSSGAIVPISTTQPRTCVRRHIQRHSATPPRTLRR